MAGDVLDEMRRIAGRKFDASKAFLLMREVDPDKDVDVPDPWSGPESGYEEAFEMMDEACERIVERYGGEKAVNGKRQATGIDDPDGKGKDALIKGGLHD